MRYIIEIDSQTLPPEDSDFHRTDLIVMMRDALQDFLRAREHPVEYVRTRYANHDSRFRGMKLRDVERRNRVVKYLLRHGYISVDIQMSVGEMKGGEQDEEAV